MTGLLWLVGRSLAADDGYSCEQEAALYARCREDRDPVACAEVKKIDQREEASARVLGYGMFGASSEGRRAADRLVCEARKMDARNRTLGAAQIVASAFLIHLRFDERAMDDPAALWTRVPEYPPGSVVYSDGRVDLSFDEVARISSLREPWRVARVLQYGCTSTFLAQEFTRTENTEELGPKADGARVSCEARAILREGLRRTYQVERDTFELVYEGPLVTPDNEDDSSPAGWRLVSMERQMARRGGHPASFFLRAEIGLATVDGRALSNLGQQVGFRLGRTPFPLVAAWAPHLDLSLTARQIGFAEEDAGAQVELGGQVGVGFRRANGQNWIQGVTLWARYGRATNDRFGIERGSTVRTVGFDDVFGSAGGARGRGLSLLATASVSRIGGTGVLGGGDAITGLTGGFGIVFDGYLSRVEEVHEGALTRP